MRQEGQTARDLALRRLRRLTVAAAAISAGAVALFGAVSAVTIPGQATARTGDTTTTTNTSSSSSSSTPSSGDSSQSSSGIASASGLQSSSAGSSSHASSGGS